jgi:hypothetical protein
LPGDRCDANWGHQFIPQGWQRYQGRLFDSKMFKDKCRYLMMKNCKHFKATGCGSARSKIGSELICWLEPMEGDECDYMLTQFAGEFQTADLAKPLFFKKLDDAPIGSTLKDLASNITTKAASLVVKLSRAENKGLRGLMSQVEVTDIAGMVERASTVSAHPPSHVDKGFGPYAHGIRKHTLRFGAQAWPVAGIGCWVYAHDSPVQVALIDPRPLYTDCGLQSLDNLEAALEHKKAMTLKHSLCLLPTGGVLWCPYVYVPLVTTASEIATFAVFPHFSSDLAAQADPDVLDAVLAVTIKHAKRNKANAEQPMWSLILEPLETLTK